MCGRFTLINWEELVERFGIEAEDLKPRYNIAPTQAVPVIVYIRQPVVKMFRWGLIPYWAQDAAIGSRLINARAETIEEKSSYRQSFKQKRCLVPADGFYEWEKSGKAKIPYRFTLKDEELFTIAGLWDVWHSPEGKDIHSFTIITTSANSLVAAFHDRMPVILPKEAEKLWLAPGFQNAEVLRELLAPYPAHKMNVGAVSPRVNNPAYDFPDVLSL